MKKSDLRRIIREEIENKFWNEKVREIDTHVDFDFVRSLLKGYEGIVNNLKRDNFKDEMIAEYIR